MSAMRGTNKTRRPKGRPAGYSPDIATVICERIADGDSLRAVCQSIGMPSRATVLRWLAAQPEFCDQYARAREVQADLLAEQILEIADTPLEGERHEEGETAQGAYSKTVREDMLGHRRLQVDARKWAAAKLAPKKYGERIAHEVQGTGRGGAIQINITPGDADL